METIYNAHWEGPFELDYLNDELEKKDNHVLYQIYGRHPLYGHNVLLYIGKAEEGAKKRLLRHMSNWAAYESDSCKAYAASLGKFENWEKFYKIAEYSKPDNVAIEKVEKLLIFAHQPAYNTMSKKSVSVSQKIRIFNTGRFGSLNPEISGLYYIGI